MKKKLMFIFGTRPEAIKMAPLIKRTEEQNRYISTVVVTGQHREMLDQILETFKISPHYDLNIMKKEQTVNEITCRILEQLPLIFDKEKPDMVLVHGDTTTAFTAALAAFYAQIPIGHVESGLRTGNKYSPFPEEMNRRMIDDLSDIYFAPTEVNRINLLNEHHIEKNIFVTGNTAIDALDYTIAKEYQSILLDNNKKNILVTIHRRENLGNSMINVFKAINKIVGEFSDIQIIFPIHKNKEIRRLANRYLMESKQIKIVEPLSIIDFQNIMNKSYLILTDSGGVQEEATSLGIPTLVLRDTTERPEGVDAGVLKLIGTNTDRIYEEVKKLLINEEVYNQMTLSTNPYGKGNSCLKILKSINEFFGLLE